MMMETAFGKYMSIPVRVFGPDYATSFAHFVV
jgi:hypothetical protein